MHQDDYTHITAANQRAWNNARFETWTKAYGSAKEAAAQIISNPEHILRRLLPYLGDVADTHICNIQGSHGRIAVALAKLGADVHVIDFSQENKKFAMALAKAAQTSISYTVCDVIQADNLKLSNSFDKLVLELGILHYHQDLNAFFATMRKLLHANGSLLLNEFHPVQRKLYWNQGPHNYFHTDLVQAEVPNPLINGASLGKCNYRFWTMADVINALVNAGFIVTQLEEHPDWEDPTIPGTFTLLAKPRC